MSLPAADWTALHAGWRAWAIDRRLTADQFIAGALAIDNDPEHFWVAGLPAVERIACNEQPPKPQTRIVRV